MKYTNEEINDFITEIQAECNQHNDDCIECPFRDRIFNECNFKNNPNCWGLLEKSHNKRVPFDFSKKEDRDAVIGRYIIHKYPDNVSNWYEGIVSGII